MPISFTGPYPIPLRYYSGPNCKLHLGQQVPEPVLQWAKKVSLPSQQAGCEMYLVRHGEMDGILAINAFDKLIARDIYKTDMQSLYKTLEQQAKRIEPFIPKGCPVYCGRNCGITTLSGNEETPVHQLSIFFPAGTPATDVWLAVWHLSNHTLGQQHVPRGNAEDFLEAAEAHRRRENKMHDFWEPELGFAPGCDTTIIFPKFKSKEEVYIVVKVESSTQLKTLVEYFNSGTNDDLVLTSGMFPSYHIFSKLSDYYTYEGSLQEYLQHAVKEANRAISCLGEQRFRFEANLVVKQQKPSTEALLWLEDAANTLAASGQQQAAKSLAKTYGLQQGRQS